VGEPVPYEVEEMHRALEEMTGRRVLFLDMDRKFVLLDRGTPPDGNYQTWRYELHETDVFESLELRLLDGEQHTTSPAAIGRFLERAGRKLDIKG
jgi:hypothetical protein